MAANFGVWQRDLNAGAVALSIMIWAEVTFGKEE